MKIVGDFVDNYRRGLPSEMGLLNLFDPRTGQPVAIIDAAGLTDMRTGAVTAIGARHLARKDRAACSGTSARAAPRTGTCACSTSLFHFDEIRVHSRRPESRDAFAGGCRATSASPSPPPTTGSRACAAPTSWSKPRGCRSPTPMLRTEWIKRGAFVVPYGTMSAVELSLTDIMDKLVVDDWGQCKAGQFGSLRAHVDAGKLSESTLHAELGEIVAGRKPGRERDDETILLWHRGLSLSDIALGAAMLAQGEANGDRPAAALPMRIANARMYSVNCRGRPTRGARCLQWVIERAERRRRGHRLSGAAAAAGAVGRAPISRARSCAGIPLSRADPAPSCLAAPVPEPARLSRRRPVYWTNLVVAHGRSRFARSTDAFGKRIAFTTPDSQSGYQAPRAFFAPHARRAVRRCSPRPSDRLITPRRVVEAVLAGEADIGPVDSYAFDLMRRHEPHGSRRFAVIARTAPTPIPPLVGAPGLPPTTSHSALSGGPLVRRRGRRARRDARCASAPRIRTAASAADYDVLREAAEAATTLGYPRLE